MTLFSRSAKYGFTLVEMLVVIAIISIVASTAITAVKGAQRQARATKCQANLHALHKAVLAYYADHERFPPAGAYEFYMQEFIAAQLTKNYTEHRGWVNWVRKDSVISRRKSEGRLYGKGGTVSSSKAASYVFVGPGCGQYDYTGSSGKAGARQNVHLSRIYRSIDEGAIFKYTDKNFSVYCCEEFKNKYPESMRSYAMNYLYGSRRIRRQYDIQDHPGTAHRLAMFVELNATAGTKTGAVGQTAGDKGDAATPSNVFYNDSTWDWDNENENIKSVPESIRKKIRHTLKGENLQGGAYKKIYSCMLQATDKQTLNTALVKVFTQEDGNRYYKQIVPIFTEWER